MGVPAGRAQEHLHSHSLLGTSLPLSPRQQLKVTAVSRAHRVAQLAVGLREA